MARALWLRRGGDRAGPARCRPCSLPACRPASLPASCGVRRRAQDRDRTAGTRVPNWLPSVGVAQLVRAPGCGPGGRGFKSPRSPRAREVSALCAPSTRCEPVRSGCNAPTGVRMSARRGRRPAPRSWARAVDQRHVAAETSLQKRLYVTSETERLHTAVADCEVGQDARLAKTGVGKSSSTSQAQEAARLWGAVGTAAGGSSTRLWRAWRAVAGQRRRPSLLSAHPPSTMGRWLTPTPPRCCRSNGRTPLPSAPADPPNRAPLRVRKAVSPIRRSDPTARPPQCAPM